MPRAKPLINHPTSRAIGYACVPPDATDEELEAQRRKLQQWCDENQSTLLAVHTDRAESPTPIHKREGYIQAIVDTKAQMAGLLLITHPDILAPGSAQFAVANRVTARAGAELFCVEDHAGSVFDSEAMEVLDQALESYHVLIYAPRIRDGLHKRRERGLKLGGAVPYGFRVSEDGNRLVHNDEEREVLQVMAEMRKNRSSYRQIANELERRGIRNREGRKWHPQSIKNQINRLKKEGSFA